MSINRLSEVNFIYFLLPILTKCLLRLQILQYFEGANSTSLPRSNCCDNCQRSLLKDDALAQYEDLDIEYRFDYTKDATSLLQVIALFDGYCGLGKSIAIITGISTQHVKQFHTHSLFGIGRYKSGEYWHALAELLENNEFLSRQCAPYPTIALTQKGKSWLLACLHPAAMLLKPTKSLLQFLRKKRVDHLYETTVHGMATTLTTPFPYMKTKSSCADLEHALYQCRSDLAGIFNVMPYMIASNKVIAHIASIQPLNMDELRAAQIDGQSEAQILQFGPSLLLCVLKHKNHLPEVDSLVIILLNSVNFLK